MNDGRADLERCLPRVRRRRAAGLRLWQRRAVRNRGRRESGQEFPGARRSCFRVFGEEAPHDRPGLSRQPGEIGLASSVGEQDIRVGVAFERRSPGQQLIGHYAQAVQIGAFVSGSLGRQIGRRTQECRCAGDAGEVDPFGDPEVGELGDPIRAEQNVGGLEVAVDDPGGMGIGQSGRDLGEEGACLRPRVWPMFGELLAQRGPVHVFQGQVGRALAGTVAEHLHHVSRVDAPGQLQLALEAGDVVGIVGVERVQKLEGDDPSGRLVAGHPD